jgi:hypothetical protein
VGYSQEIWSESTSFARSSLCLVLFSDDGQDGPTLRAVNGEGFIILIDEACTPAYIDINISVMRSMRTSLKTSFAVMNSSDIHARGWKYQVLGVT